ncbi:MAG: hypothetical protein AB7G93_00825 [Bdellovibrionales bacterium]
MNKKLNPNATLKEAKDWLRARLGKGERCPCCNQLAKMYERKLYSSMAAAIIYFYKSFDHSKFHHKSELLKNQALATTLGGGDFAKLALWGLIEEKPKDTSEDKRTSGYWKISQKGIDFVLGKQRLPSHVRIYDGKVFGFTGDKVLVTDCLGKKFSYVELMGLKATDGGGENG